jgi:SAM-dependent methyltransferase
MLVAQPRRGLVLDLGCGYAALADPLRDAGFEYVGLDVDALAIDSLRARGFAAEHIDLSAVDVVGRLVALAGGRPVAAITAIDVIEHLSPHQPLLDAIAEAARQLDCLVGFSIPNVSHVDLGLKLMIGRWDITDIGLLDSTHVSLFDHRRLAASLAVAGLEVIAVDDMPALFTEQATPFDHPALRTDAPLGQVLRAVRDAADEHAHTYQFVRLCRPVAPVAPAAPAPEPHHMTPVEVGFTVAVMVPDPADDARPLLDLLAAQTVAPTQVLTLGPGPIGALIATAIEAATGSHLCVLSAGEYVPAGWLEAFGEVAAGYGHRVLVHPAHVRRGGVEVEVRGWEPLQLLSLGGSPTSAFAVPLAAVRHLRLGPDPAVAEAAWRHLVVRVAASAGVAPCTSGATTPVRARNPECSSLLASFGPSPILLGPGWHAEVGQLVQRAAQADAIARSRAWRLLRVLRAPLGLVRRLVRRVVRR